MICVGDARLGVQRRAKVSATAAAEAAGQQGVWTVDLAGASPWRVTGLSDPLSPPRSPLRSSQPFATQTPAAGTVEISATATAAAAAADFLAALRAVKKTLLGISLESASP